MRGIMSVSGREAPGREARIMSESTMATVPAIPACEGPGCTFVAMGAVCGESRAARIIHAYLHEAFPA